VNKNITHIIDHFSPISLNDVDTKILLPNRIDTKFIFSSHILNHILAQLADEYQILEINNEKWQTYSTFYYDTPEKKFYFHHHQGKANRYKIRIRHYHTTKDVFFELKSKSNLSITRKKRIRLSEQINYDAELPQLLKKVGIHDDLNLELSLANKFTRITLANVEKNERATIDFDLSFTKNGEEIGLPYLVICEVKTNKKFSNSTLYKVLKTQRIYPTRISKYVVGNILFDQKLKKNRFKEKMILLKKIENEYYTS